MLTVEQALAEVIARSRPLRIERISLEAALGRVLAEPILCPIELPPFRKALMDGYAVRADDLASGEATLRVLERVVAGSWPTQPLIPGTATEIMTGAPLPDGADAVIRVEDSQRHPTTGDAQSDVAANDLVTLRGTHVRPGTNMIDRGVIRQPGQQVLPAGTRLNATMLGALAELGIAELSVARRPSVAVLATGNELVDIDQTPGQGQIRNSNGLMLCQQFAQMGAITRSLGIARDDIDDLTTKVRNGLRDDVLVLSGGVSAGTLDLVPQVLRSVGVVAHFHKVAMKPGKPLLFGTSVAAGGLERAGLVFGLPGNPVSSMVCAELFVQTALRCLSGDPAPGPRRCLLPVSHDHRHRSDRPTFQPARWIPSTAGLSIELVPWQGSSDLQGVAGCQVLAVFPAGELTIAAGTLLEVIPLSGAGSIAG